MILRLQQQIEALNSRIEALDNGGSASRGTSYQSIEEVEPSESLVRSIVKFQPFASPLNRDVIVADSVPSFRSGGMGDVVPATLE